HLFDIYEFRKVSCFSGVQLTFLNYFQLKPRGPQSYATKNKAAYNFEYVKNKLSDNPLITPDIYLEVEKIKESLKEQDSSSPDNRSFDSDKQILEKITAIIQEKLTASQMLIRSKDRLLEHSSTISDDLYGKVMNELYISKWYEMSLIDKEEVPGENISLQNYNHYIPSYERYELNDRGIKYIQMLEIETKK
ncbi:MAG: hypothetical protein IJG09_06490, partial [Methanobrevibacter sp.]|nr:hypothetical protein [Methanobrevibacter sp.]